MKPVELNLKKPYEARNGNKARLICLNAKGYDSTGPGLCYVFLVETGECHETVVRTDKYGRTAIGGEHNLDIVNVPVKTPKRYGRHEYSKSTEDHYSIVVEVSDDLSGCFLSLSRGDELGTKCVAVEMSISVLGEIADELKSIAEKPYNIVDQS